MFVERIEKYKQTAKRKYLRFFYIYDCDFCNTRYEIQGRASTGKFNFCCKQCMLHSQKTGGKLDIHKRQVFLERLGVENPSQSRLIKEKKEITLLKNYGVHSPVHSEEIKQKIIETNLTKYGYACSLMSASSQKKITESLEKLCIKNIAQRSDVLEKIKKTMLSKYGVEHIFSSKEIREKIKKTMLSKYGVESPFDLRNCKENRCSQIAAQRRHITMKRNGTYRSSKPENKLYILLCEKFGEKSIERNIPILGTRWSIDFFICTKNIYIQFDGTYWHGLDRPIETIAEYKNKRDVIIHKKWLTDRKQNEWFSDKGLILLRLTEKNDMITFLSTIDNYCDTEQVTR